MINVNLIVKYHPCKDSHDFYLVIKLKKSPKYVIMKQLKLTWTITPRVVYSLSYTIYFEIIVSAAACSAKSRQVLEQVTSQFPSFHGIIHWQQRKCLHSAHKLVERYVHDSNVQKTIYKMKKLYDKVKKLYIK